MHIPPWQILCTLVCLAVVGAIVAFAVRIVRRKK